MKITIMTRPPNPTVWIKAESVKEATILDEMIRYSGVQFQKAIEGKHGTNKKTGEFKVSIIEGFLTGKNKNAT